MKPSSPGSGKNPVIALESVAAVFEVPLRKRKTHWKAGDTTHTLRADYRGHRIEAYAGSTLLVMHVEAAFGDPEFIEVSTSRNEWGNCEIEGPTLRTASQEYRVFSFRKKFLPAQTRLLGSSGLKRILTAVRLEPGEQVMFAKDLVGVFLSTATKRRIMALLHSIIRHFPRESDRVIEKETLPDALRPLESLLDKWAISDDEERSRCLRRSAASTRRRLIDKVTPLLPIIDEYLDQFGQDPPEHCLPWSDLAQAAIEARLLLEQE